MSWLREYVAVELSAGELAERLLAAGLPVEGIERVGEEFRAFVVGRIERVEPHPRRPHLMVAHVSVGDRTLQVVTGAPNARPGLMTAVAVEGVYVPAMRTHVAASEFAGIRSEAVVLSPKEAGISDDDRGLWELTGPVEVGQSLAEALGLEDEVLDVDVYPNRADCMSVVGLAREVAAVLQVPLRLPPAEFDEQPEPAEAFCDVAVEDEGDCPRYLARVMWELPAGHSPWWLARRLHLAGMRALNPVVDVTNYVMLEVGQPLHAFDLDRLAGGRVVVRRARPGEQLVTLDGKRHELDGSLLVIADAERPQALAGVMGGADSEISEATRVMLLESATFHPALIRRAGRRLGLRTEASARFERGLAPALADWGSRRAAALLAAMGARVARGCVDRQAKGAAARRALAVRPERINRVLGTRFTAEEIAQYLRRLDVAADNGGAAPLRVRIPEWRRDLAEEDDLAEEVARLFGYDRIPTTLPEATARGRRTDEFELAFAVRRALSAAGLFETVTYSFMSLAELRALGIPDGHPWLDALRVANPLSDEQSHLRTTLLCGLIRALKINVNRRQGDIRLFEVGRVFWPRRPETAGDPDAAAQGGGSAPEPAGVGRLPQERLMVGVAMLSVPAALPRRWYEPPRPLDFFDLKGVVEALAAQLRVAVRAEPAALPALHPARAARLLGAGRHDRWMEVGWAGELHPSVAATLDLPGRPLVAELDLNALAGLRHREVRFAPLPRFPSVVRDLALLVPEEMAAARLVQLVRQHAGPYAREVELFDVYAGPGVPPGMRSLGVSITYQAEDRTLLDEEVDRARAELVGKLESLGVRLR